MARLMHAVRGSMRRPLGPGQGQPASPDREHPAAAATMRRATRGGSATLHEDVPFTRLNRITSMHPGAAKHEEALGGSGKGGMAAGVGVGAVELPPQLPVKLLACTSIAHRYNETLMYSEAPASPTTQVPGPPRRLGTTARPAAISGAHKSSRWSFWGGSGSGGGTSSDGTSPKAQQQQQQNPHQQQNHQQPPSRPTRLSLSVGGGSATTTASSPTPTQPHRASSPSGLLAFFSASGRAQQAGSATSGSGGGSGRLRMSLPRLASRFNRSSRPRPNSGEGIGNGSGDAASGCPDGFRDGTTQQQLMLTPLVAPPNGNGHAGHAPPAASHHPQHADKPGATAHPPTPPSPLPAPPVIYPAPAPALPPHLFPAHSAGFNTYSSSSLHVAFAPSGHHASASLPIGFGGSTRLGAGGGSPGASRLGLASFAVANSVKGAFSRLGGHMPSGSHALAGGTIEEGACFDEFYRDINTLTARMVMAGAAAAAASASAYPNPTSTLDHSFNRSVHGLDRSVHGHSVAGSRAVDVPVPGWNHVHGEQQHQKPQQQQQHPLLLQKQRSGPGVPGPRSSSDVGSGGEGGSGPLVSWTLMSILRMLFVQMDPEEAHIYMEQQEQQRNMPAGGQPGSAGAGVRGGSEGAAWGGGVVSGMLGRMATSIQSSGGAGGGGGGPGAGVGAGAGSLGRSEEGEVELALRGLRVRVGLHSGARDSEVRAGGWGWGPAGGVGTGRGREQLYIKR